ncbi:MAG: SpoVR family protein [Acidobacteriota bacterium]|nr:SpoVR family protein [Blastocatellia bacterium]MDW8239479.1 SpoVR family protein [Acidobacteriota bacterium]
MINDEIQQLEAAIDQIWEKGTQMGLDPYPTHFEIVPASVMYEIGSYGLPGRYSHWTFGKAYHKMKMMYDFGLSRIYEVVINTDPAYAFLLEGNSLVQNKMIIAHVMAHVDFFKHNVYFSPTNRNMLDIVANHAARIREYEFKYGQKTVEAFLDAVLSIQEHIDPNFFIRKPETPPEQTAQEKRPRRRSPYDDLFEKDENQAPATSEESPPREPPQPEKDIVYYIMKNSPVLEPWQRDIMGMIHEETAYFIPQMQTKIMNEGWASFWHSRIMREIGLSDNELLEFAHLHSAVVSPHRGSLNPYYVGYRILEDIEKRWDNPTEEERERYRRRGGEGRQKLFEVRQLDNDISFLRNYLTKELIEDLDLFIFQLRDEEEWVITDKNWEHVRNQLVADMTNFGFPYIEVLDADYNRNRELYLRHRFEGAELDLDYAQKTLEYVYKLWGRSVYLETVVDNEPLVMGYDGKEHWEE